MKKLTKSSLEELAQTMPVLSEMEQRMCIGGDLVIVDEKGSILDPALHPNMSKIISGIELKQNDNSQTHWYVVSSGGGKVLDNCTVNGRVNSVSGMSLAGNDPVLEGSAVTTNVLKMLGDHTDVEWMMAEKASGNFGRLTTSKDPTRVYYDPNKLKENWGGFSDIYHTHPYQGRDAEDTGVSQTDRENTGDFIEAGFQRCHVYDATKKEWKKYYGD